MGCSYQLLSCLVNKKFFAVYNVYTLEHSDYMPNKGTKYHFSVVQEIKSTRKKTMFIMQIQFRHTSL